MPVKNEEEAYEKIIDMSNNNVYTNGNLLDFGYFKENYKLLVNFPEQEEQQCSVSLKNQKKLLLIFYEILPQSYQKWKHKRL